MQKITPFLWFDNQAEEAMDFYVSVFRNSEIRSVSRYGEHGPGPAGTVMSATFQLDGRQFMALNGGPIFKFTPAISFFVSSETPQEIDETWENLSTNGTVLMELGRYPFSEKFGWVEDQFGLSWQLNLAPHGQPITPCLMFVGEQRGKANEAIDFYCSLFEHSNVAVIERYGPGEGEPEGTVKFASFTLDGQPFIAMENSFNHAFTFTPATSFFVSCETQQEVDELWEKLSAGGRTQQCGWLQDKFGVSWQIVPTILGELLQDENAAKAQNVMKAMLQMEKIEIEPLKLAYEQG